MVAGSYDFIVRAYYSDYDLNTIESEIFTATIIDPCVNPTITAPEDQTVEYYIGDGAAKFNFVPPFSVSPNFCTSRIEFSANLPAIDDNLTGGEDGGTFGPLTGDDLDLAGETETTYPITVTYTTGNGDTENDPVER